MSTAEVITSGAYVPRTGDRVTVRRYIRPTGEEHAPEFEHTGIVTEAEPEADGWFLRLDSYPDRIFTGYQFLGAGADGRSPASLVTEVVLVADTAGGTFARQLSPELVVAVDGSQCIVLLVGGTGPADPIRTVTVTNVDAFKAALDDAREAQHAELAEGSVPRLAGLNDKRRAQGRLTQHEAVEWLIGRGYMRDSAVRAAIRIRGGHPGPGKQAGSMTYDGTYWVVPARQG